MEKTEHSLTQHSASSKALTASPASPTATLLEEASRQHESQSSMASQTYTSEHLKRVGMACGNRLPPASAIQAMFLYEMQRQTEQERLFGDQMFRLAKQEHDGNEQEQRIDTLEQRLTQLEKQVAAADLVDRLATSQTRMIAQGELIKKCNTRVDDMEKKLDALEGAILGLRLTVTTKNSSTKDDDLVKMAEEIDVLFQDRDGLLVMCEELRSDLDTTLDHVRLMTEPPVSSATAATTTTSKMAPQRLELKTNNGERLDLAVPKGSAHVS